MSITCKIRCKKQQKEGVRKDPFFICLNWAMLYNICMSKKPSWDKYFMGMAEQAATRSIDPHYKVGAVIVSKDNRILSTGYNGFPSGWNEKRLNWNKKDELRPYIVHAEMNALIYSRCCLKKAKIYSTLCPCMNCVLLLAAAGIKKIYYKQEYKHDKSVRLFCKKLGIALKKIS